MRTFLLLILLCMAQTMQARHLIIFETDMGNDVDDAWALDMLHKYADEGRLEYFQEMKKQLGVNEDYALNHQLLWCLIYL